MSAPGGGLADALRAQEDRLSHCVHCGFCLPACPTYVRLGDEADSPRGRLYLMRALAEGRIEAEADAFQTHIDRCLGCRACEPVCPAGVEYGVLLERARAEAIRVRPPSLLERILLHVVASPRLGRIVFTLGALVRRTGLARWLGRRLPDSFRSVKTGFAMLAGSGPWRPGDGDGALPSSDPRRSRPAPSAREGRGTVALLEGCVQRGLAPHVARAAGRVLLVNGHDLVEAPGQGCCGALHAHAGELEGARALALRNMDAFEASGCDLVVASAAGCGAAMKEYGSLFEATAQAGRAAAFARRVRDVSEVLGASGEEPVEGGGVDCTVVYDAPCHLIHGQGVSGAVEALLDAVPGIRRLELEGASECCGGAGTYGLTHPELGGRIGDDKAEAIERSSAELVVTANVGCAMQIGARLLLAGSECRVAHPVEVLDESYRRAGHYERAGSRAQLGQRTNG